ncbi:hypothetical protein JCM11641_006400 [Rhodosporidiobolus odoratus]
MLSWSQSQHTQASTGPSAPSSLSASLEPELLHLIAIHLEQPTALRAQPRRDALNFALTCRAWYRPGIEALYHSVVIWRGRGYELAQAITATQDRAGLVRRLKVQVGAFSSDSADLDSVAVETIFRSCPRLEKIELAAGISQITAALLRATSLPVLRSFSSLGWLKATPPGGIRSFFLLLQRTPRLQEANLRVIIRPDTPVEFPELPQPRIQLRRLNLNVFGKRDAPSAPVAEQLDHVASAFDFTHLVSFTAHTTPEDPFVTRHLTSASSLIHLTLFIDHDSLHPFFTSLISLLPSLPQLRTLKIDVNAFPVPGDLSAPSLTQLNAFFTALPPFLEHLDVPLCFPSGLVDPVLSALLTSECGLQRKLKRVRAYTARADDPSISHEVLFEKVALEGRWVETVLYTTARDGGRLEET